MAIALLAASSTSSQANGAEAEATCVTDALFAQIDAKQAPEIEGPTATCKARYSWTAEETDAAVAIANALGDTMAMVDRLLKAGGDIKLIDELTSKLSDTDIATLGTYGEEFSSERLIKVNSVLFTIANLVSPRVQDANAQILLQRAIHHRCVTRNTIRAFMALRAKRH